MGGVIQRSCLDHITTNCVSKMSKPEVIGLSKSDHLGISIVKSSKEIRSSPKTTKKRIYKNFSKDQFLNEIKEAQERGLFEDMFDQNDVDKATEIFTAVFKEILEKHAPLRVIQNRTNYIPYISNDIKEAMDKRDKLKVAASKTGNLDDFNQYKTERNKVTYMLRNAKKAYFDEKFNDETASSSDIWKTAYLLLGSFRSCFPSQMMISGHLISKPILLATGKNEFFIKKISDLKSEGIIVNDTEAANEVLSRFLSGKEIPQDGVRLGKEKSPVGWTGYADFPLRLLHLLFLKN